MGENLNLLIKLKEVDYAFIGPPNSGKTTLINKLCGTNFDVSFIPGNTASVNIACLNKNNFKICEKEDFCDITILDIPGLLDIRDFLTYHKVLCMSKNIIILSDDTSLMEHQRFLSELKIFDRNLMAKVSSIVLTKNDEGSTAKESNQICSIPLLKISSVSGIGIQDLIGKMIFSNMGKS